MNQQIQEKIQVFTENPKAITAMGAGGMGMSLVDIANTAQAIGFIIGALLIVGQFVVFCISQYNRYKRYRGK